MEMIRWLSGALFLMPTLLWIMRIDRYYQTHKMNKTLFEVVRELRLAVFFVFLGMGGFFTSTANFIFDDPAQQETASMVVRLIVGAVFFITTIIKK